MILNLNSGNNMVFNFKIVGSTTRPVDLKDNTIWVNTEHEITEWELKSTEPSNPKDGMVWIKIELGGLTEFNALKKNGIYISPMLAKQYLNSSWTDVEMKVYQGGEWGDGTYYLYIDGDERTAITGGWSITASYYTYDEYDSGYAGKTPSVSRGTSSVTVSATASSSSNSEGQSGLFHTVNKIDLTNFKKLYMDGSILAKAKLDATGIYIRNNLNHYYGKEYVKRELASSLDKRETKVFSIDVSDLSGEYYICLACGSYLKEGTSQIVMNSMWLET